MSKQVSLNLKAALPPTCFSESNFFWQRVLFRTPHCTFSFEPAFVLHFLVNFRFILNAEFLLFFIFSNNVYLVSHKKILNFKVNKIFKFCSASCI